VALAEFFAPWCGHCKRLAPEYEKAATALKQEDLPVALIKVDCTVNTETCSKHGVSGYPTLKIFRNGKDSEYKGPRKTDGIVSYMKKQVGPAAKIVHTEAELQALLKKDPNVQYVVAGFFQSAAASQLQTSFSMLSNSYRDDYVFAKITDHPELNAKYSVDEEGEGLVVFLFGEAKKYEGSSRRSDVEDFIKENSTPLIGVMNSENGEVYSKKRLPIGKVFMKVEIASVGSKHLKYYTNRLAKIAEEYKGQIQLVLADKTSLKSEAEHFNIQDDEFAFVISDSVKNTAHRYDAPDEAKIGKFDPAGYKEFVEEFLKGDAPKYVKSQRAPKNHGSVTTVVGTTFEDIVLDDEKDVMIEFYAPWCGHCKSLEPKYKEVGDKFKGNDNVVIAKMDATANDWDRSTFEVKGYPTIFFKPAGKKASLYEGPREITDILNYIKKKGKYAKKNGKKNDDDEEEVVEKKSKKKTKKE